ncbi:MAG TPA: PAS domain S-box protein, partial [Methylomirabilota bacterium]|nr:PAS domain S-box protein [Methylomirabilota bacterium]
MTPSHPATLGSPEPDLVRDPDEDARTIRRLMESEERLRGILEAITNFVIRFDPTGRFTFVNDAYCRHVGQSRETILGPDWYDFGLIPPDERVRHDRHLASLTVDAPIATIELRCILPDGRTVLEEWTDHGIFDVDGRLVEIQAVGRDVTEQRRMLSDLAESEARYRAVVEAQTEFIVRMTPDGYLTFVNDAYCRYHGRSREELLSPHWCD